MTLDKITRMAIASAVTKAVKEANEVYEEQWLTSDQLSERVGVFTKEWIKKNGSMLPRERVCFTNADGNIVQSSRWMYPVKKILRLLHEGEFRMMKVS